MRISTIHRYYLIRGYRYNSDGTEVYISNKFKLEDKLGISLNFRDNLGILKFFKNGIDLNIDVNNLQGEFYPCIFFISCDSKISLLFNENN